MPNELEQLVPPAIPQSSFTYSRSLADAHNNVLRLFFTRLTQMMRILLDPQSGAKVLYFPHGGYYDTTTQTAVSANTEYLVSFGTTDHNSTDLSIVDGEKVTVEAFGVYHVAVSLQVGTTSSTTDSLLVWFKKNGENLDETTREYLIDGDRHVQLTQSMVLEVDDYIEVAWEVTSTDIQLQRTAATGNHSGIPSARLSISFVGNG